MPIPLWARLMEAEFCDCGTPNECNYCWWNDFIKLWRNLAKKINEA